jgi:hypothetical protein
VQAEWDARAQQMVAISDARREGYEQELQHLAEFRRRDPASGRLLSVDVHMRFSTAFDHESIDAAAVYKDAVQDPDTGMWIPAPEDIVCHLAYHAWWDTQSVSNIRNLRDLRLSHFVDIHRVIDHDDLSIERILRRAEQLGSTATVNWALCVLLHLFDGYSAAGVDFERAVVMDLAVSDRWLQRETANPLSTGLRRAGTGCSTRHARQRR